MSFATAPLRGSVAPRRPGPLRRWLPLGLLVLGALLLGMAALGPRFPATVPVRAGTVVLVNDISDSMTSTDVRPSRLGAAQRAADGFLGALPRTVAIGVVAFARRAQVLAFPATDRADARTAIASLRPGGGGTAIGDALGTALAQIASVPRVAGRRPPGTIVLLSDGTSNVGTDPLAVAADARRAHVRIDTVAIGTPGGRMTAVEHGRHVIIPAPVSPDQLAQVAASSGGTFFRAPDDARARAVYAHLAATLGHRRVLRSWRWAFAAAGLLVGLAAAGLSLLWFGRLI